MMRFIFICMGVVALSVLSIVTQVMTEGISAEQTLIAERNNAGERAIAAVEPAAGDLSAEQLNDIESAAGGDAPEQESKFGAAFTDEAPKALAEPAATDVMQAQESAQ